MSDWPKSWLAASPGRRCPGCGDRTGRPILWGMPSFEAIEALEAGVIDIAIGGCCISDADPRYECGNCGHRFGGAVLRDSDLSPLRSKAEP